MNGPQRSSRFLAAGLVVCLWTVLPSPAVAQQRVADTLHNLSVSGPGAIHSVSETQVCKFCHIPHNAVVPHPLWGHTLSSADYRVPDVISPSGGKLPAPQPDGSSRLCLSCHDGTVALGDLGGKRPIPMLGSQRLTPGRRGFIGTDLSGSHPISFVVRDATGARGAATERDMGLRPLSSITADPDVRLDAMGKMQCTTCHDPHSDQYYKKGQVPHFWVKPTVQEVCITCHALR
ncbi:MAG: hypothetical protein GXP48_02165 [Acidobacteria bacterium]|nr:hypothetical protein [Acidobacteriota bacterium]